MKRRAVAPTLASVAAWLAIFLAVGACSGGETTGDLALVVSAEQAEVWVRNFNPLVSDSRWPSAGGIYEPLMVQNPFTEDYVPWLATDVEWDETDQIAVFSIRPEVHWSDGRPFTVDDVIFTFELLRKHPNLDSGHVWRNLSEVRAAGPGRVAFEFRTTYVPGLVPIAAQSIVPRHLWEHVADPASYANETPVGTGPYTRVLRFEDDVYELGRNPNYWQPGRPAVAKLRMPLFRDNEEVVAGLLAGEVDWSGDFVPNVENDFVAQDPERRGSWSPLIEGAVLLYANTTVAPFSDASVRRALSLAIDRDRVVEEAVPGVTRPADATALDDSQIHHHSEEAAEKGSAWVAYDPDAAARVLDEAGYPVGPSGHRGPAGGEPWSLEMLVPGGWSDWVAATRLIREQLAAVGIETTEVRLSQDAWSDRVERGDFQLSLGWTLSGPTPYTTYRWLMSSHTVRPVGESSPGNWHRFGDPAADALLEAIELAGDESIQEELYRQLQLLFVDLAPAIPLFLGPSWGNYNSARFEGFPSADNPYAPLSPYRQPARLLVLANLRPR